MNTPMMRVWLRPVDAANKVRSMKLTLVSPPWPHVGQELTYLGAKWMVTKTSATRGILISVGPTGSTEAERATVREKE